MGQAPSLEALLVLELRQGMIQIFKASPRLNGMALQHQVDVGVGLAPVAVLIGPDDAVGLRDKHVGLYASAQRHLVVLSLHGNSLS